jgi:hypothetical protein
MRWALMVAILGGITLTAQAQQADTVPADIPLAEVLSATSRNLALGAAIRVQLMRARLSRSEVMCQGHRLDGQWAVLGGSLAGPYSCQIGSRAIFITATQTFYDASGRKLIATDSDFVQKAARIVETNFRWRWRALP